MRGMLLIIMNRRKRRTGMVTSTYVPKTIRTHRFISGSLRPFQLVKGRTVLRKGPMCVKRSGMPVASASAQ
jgi:hypothetical protein